VEDSTFEAGQYRTNNGNKDTTSIVISFIITVPYPTKNIYGVSIIKSLKPEVRGK